MSDLIPRWSRAVALCAFAGALSTLCGCRQAADNGPIQVVVQDPSNGGDKPSSEDVVELAKREGELWWYTSLPEKEAAAFLNLFHKKHPYVMVRLVRDSTFDVIRRVMTQIENGKVEADVLHVLDVAVFSDLRQQGQLLQYSPAEERNYPAEYKEPGYWWTLRAVELCIAYDTARVKENEAPRTWADLLDPRWKGRVGLKDAQTAGSAYAQYYFLREEYGASYWQRMAGLRPRIYKTAEESLQALGRGEIDAVSGAMGYTVSEAQKTHPTIRGVWPSDGVPMMPGPVAILRGAPHRNAARLFVDFALSQEGQDALRVLFGTASVRTDVQPPTGRPPLSSLHLLTPSDGWDEYSSKQDTLRAEYNRLFHPGSE